MTTYSRVNTALYAYNTAAAQCGRSEISWRRVAERCGVQPQVFFDHCDAIAQSQKPFLSPDAEALAAAILRDLEEQTAALLSARGNGADPDEEPGAKQEARADAEVEAGALKENVEAEADAEPRDGKETEQAGMIRSAISENRIDYPVVVLQGNGLPPITRQIVKHGPIVFVVTSARNNVEPEMNSRLAPADADESIAQSSMVMTYAFDGAGGLLDPTAAEEAEVELLRDFQLWLEDGGPYDVVVPFAPHIRAAFSRTPIAVRIRRDINILIAGTAACAILHKAQREVDARGRIIGTLDDYSHAWSAFNPGVSAFHHPQQAPGVIALVRVLEGMIEKGRAAKAAADDYRLRDNPDIWSPEDASFDGSVKATARQLAAMLGLASMDTISSRLGDAKAAGAIECVNESDPHNITRRYKVKISSEDLAKEGAIAVFPTPAEVVRLMKDPVAYERGRKAIGAEGASAPTPTPYDPGEVPF